MMIKQLTTFIAILMCLSISTLTSAEERNEGITCLTKGSYETAVYDKGSNGQVINTTLKVGSSYKGGNCMGRCGGGCGWGAPSAWAKDCLDHDICIVDQNGENGLATDPN